jgi:hypothetical protein
MAGISLAQKLRWRDAQSAADFFDGAQS